MSCGGRHEEMFQANVHEVTASSQSKLAQWKCHSLDIAQYLVCQNVSYPWSDMASFVCSLPEFLEVMWLTPDPFRNSITLVFSHTGPFHTSRHSTGDIY